VRRLPCGAGHRLDTFPDGDGRIRLLDPASELPVPTFRKASEAYPLVLLSPATNKTINSMFAEFDAPDAVFSMNPHDAAVRGVDDGDDVVVFNAVGRAVWPMRVDASLRPGVCHIPKGLWRRHTSHGFTANQFVDASMTDLAGGACFNDARVEVRAIGEGAAAE
jgi:anaerobic selenocysteine-containing dehydrogenase